ncbi:MAG: methionine synthase [Chloroflexi bacterium]|nr:methionine synthase [Chloroflexota bacterium]
MLDTKFGCLPTMIGSMPHTDPAEACSVITRYLKDIPAWPQLPNRSFLENMNVQYSQGFPGVVVREKSIYIDRSQALDKPLEQLYGALLENNIERYPVSPDYAAGLYAFLAMKNLSPLAVKGQVTGPITWGLSITTEDKRAILYDDVLGDAPAQLLRLKASWQEKLLRQISPNTIIFVDEPCLELYGSSGFITVTREKVISLLEEVFSGISGLKGIHCCGNTDWSVLLATSTNILSFDAYNYAQSLILYPKEVKGFLERKGTIAWGIMPNQAETLARETVASLKDRLEEAMSPFTRKGIPFKQLIEQGLLTPSCGLASLTSKQAGHTLKLLAELSTAIRKRYL